MEFTNGTAFFSGLNALGIKNISSFDSKIWGSFSNKELYSETPEDCRSKLFELAHQVGIKSDLYLSMGAEHLDNIRIIDDANIQIIKHSVGDAKIPALVRLGCDGFITKSSIPLLLSPADCAGLIMTAIDKKDGQRFLIFLHIGLAGAALKIHQKAIQIAHNHYEFEDKELEVFIFPYIYGENFLASENNLKLGLKDKPDWESFYIKNSKNEFEQHFMKKVVHELNNLGINAIEEANLDTYKEAEKGLLYSYRHARDVDIDNSGRFVILISL